MLHFEIGFHAMLKGSPRREAAVLVFAPVEIGELTIPKIEGF